MQLIENIHIFLPIPNGEDASLENRQDENVSSYNDVQILSYSELENIGNESETFSCLVTSSSLLVEQQVK